MPSAVFEEFVESGMQGWAYIKTEKETDIENPTDEATIGKLTFTLASDPFGEAIADFTWTRNSDSIPCKACWNECMTKCQLPTVTPGFIFDKKCYSKCTKKCTDVCNLLGN